MDSVNTEIMESIQTSLDLLWHALWAEGFPIQVKSV